MPNGRATGLSGLSYEIVRKVCKGEEGYNSLSTLFDYILAHPEEIPQQLNMARVIGIRKPNGGIRPICVQETLIKALNKILSLKITQLVRNDLMSTQKCIARSEGQILARN